MTPETLAKFANFTSIALTGSMIYLGFASLKEQKKLNEIIDRGTKEMDKQTTMMSGFIASIK